MEIKNKKYVSDVMAQFSCTKEMAEIILKSSEKNGEIEEIKRICKSNKAVKQYAK